MAINMRGEEVIGVNLNKEHLPIRLDYSNVFTKEDLIRINKKILLFRKINMGEE